MDGNKTTIKEYYDEVGDQYDINFAKFEEICRSIFKFIKISISSDKLMDIRLKYFGLFRVAKGRLYYFKRGLEKRYAEGDVTEEEYNKKIKFLNSYEG